MASTVATPDDLRAPTSPVANTTPRGGSRVAWLVAALSLAAWFAAMPSLSRAPVSQYGLLVAGSPLLITSILLNVLAFVLAVRARAFGQSVLCLVLTVVTQRLPTTLATAVPLYSWTYKHLGVVDWIRHHGELAHGLDVYQGWPGLFAVTGWFSDITGIAPVTIAHWFTPALHFSLLGLVYAMARAWGLTKFPALVAAFLVETLNWVGQDYYSPQATALVLAVGFLTLVGLSRRHAAATPIALVLYAAAVITHQLTPYWLIVAMVALVLIRRLSPRWIVLAMIGMAGLFLAFNYDSVSHFSLLSFNPVDNAKSNVPTVGVFGQRVTSAIVRSLSISMWLSAVACGVAQWRRKENIVAPAVLASSSFLLLGGQSYGGEAIFRVFLYSLLGCSLVIAPVLTDLIQVGRWRVGIVAPLLVAAVAASAQGFYGSWSANRMSASQVTEAMRLLSTAELPGYITVAAPVWPERSTGRYVTYLESTASSAQTFDYPMIYQAKLTGTNFAKRSEYNELVRTAGQRTTPTYLIITEQMRIYDWYFGILPLDALDNLTKWLKADNRWTLYKHTSQYTIFKSTPALIGAK